MSIGVALGHSACAIASLWKGELHEIVEYTFRTIVRCTLGKLDDADQVRNWWNSSCNLSERRFFLCCRRNVFCSTWRVVRGCRRGLDVLLVMLVISRYERSASESLGTDKSLLMIADCMKHSDTWTKQAMGGRQAFYKTSWVSSTYTGSSALAHA